MESEAVRIVETAMALLLRLDRITTDQPAVGGERSEREALRCALAAAGYFDTASVKSSPRDVHSTP